MANLALVQVTVPDCDVPLQAIRFSVGAIGATLRSLCIGLALSYATQSHRLKRNPALNGTWRSATLKTAGGRKSVDVLYAWAIPLWISGIQVSRLDAAKRARILIIQREAVQAIYRAFWESDVPAVSGDSIASIASEGASADDLDTRLEARLASLEATMRRLDREVADRFSVDEGLLAAAIERILVLQSSMQRRANQPEQKAPRRRGRPRRAAHEKP